MGYIKSLLLKIRERIRSLNIIDDDATIGKNCLIKACKISGNVEIGDNCKLVEVTLKGTIRIGRFTNIWGPNTDLYSDINEISIGNFCSIARNVTFQEYNHNVDRFTTYLINKNVFLKRRDVETVSRGSISIGHDVWIGAHSVILSGSKIGTGAVIAANSVVTGEIPPYAIAAGSPAKVIKYRFNEDVRKKLLDTAWWGWDIKKIKSDIEFLEAFNQRKSD